MTVEATAEALIPDANPEPSLADDLGAIWDKNQEEQQEQTDQSTEPEQDEEAEAVEQPVEEPEAEQAVEIPSTVPKGLREHWGAMPEGAREQVQNVIKEWSDKLSEQGRQMQGIKPIQEELAETAKSIPDFMNMKPHEVAREIRTFRETVLAPLNEKPVETLLQVAKQRGVEEQLRAALGGEQSQAGDQLTKAFQTIQQLQKQVQQLSNPEYMREQVRSITQETSVETEVNDFASKADHWSEVADYMPQFVQAARAKHGPDAPARDVLKAAYDAAVSFVVPEASKASEPTPVDEASVGVDPEKAQAASKAKSVNVSGRPSKPRQLSEKEELSAVYDRMQKQ